MKKGKKTYEKKSCKSGTFMAEAFTFVETLAVLSIGAIIAAGSTVSATKLISMAKKTAARNQIEQYSAALQSYFLDCGRFPTSEQGLSALWTKPDLYPVPENWKGPYLERKPAKDPWNTDFEYISAESSALPAEVPENLPYVLLCWGADKARGGKGEGEDIVSWQ